MKIAIYSRYLDTEQRIYFNILIETLINLNFEIYIYDGNEIFLEEKFLKSPLIKNFMTIENGHKEIEYLISLGGDGTLLDTVTIVKNSNIPIIGINMGRLGFLASFSKNDIDKIIEALQNRTYVVDKRSLLHLDSNHSIFVDNPYALNEFVIHKKDTSSMIKIHTYLNGEFLNTYWADGLIVSTPTGSTGYNLSCNGPIVFPENECFILTPIAPHNLNVRPLIISDKNIISFELEGRSDQFICSLDSRKIIADKTIQLAIKKENFCIKLLRLNENGFLSTLRSKLTWGLDIRN